MLVIVPLNLKPNNILETNAAIEDYPAWSSGSTYNKGDRVIHNYYIYEALVDDVTEEPPAPGFKGESKWLNLGMTNPYRMIDQYIETQTDGTGELVFDIQAGLPFDYIGILNADATILSVQIITKDGEDETVLWEANKTMIDIEVDNWYDYFFTEPFALKDTVFDKVPGSSLTILRIRLETPADGRVALGKLILGREEGLGCLRWGARAGGTDYSRVETDEFGRTTIIERSKAKTADFDIVYPTGDLDRIHRVINSLTTVPALWIGDDRFESLTIYGIVRDWGVVAKGPKSSEASLEILGMV